MPLSMRLRVIRVDRGFSVTYRGHEDKETGIIVVQVAPGGQAYKFGVMENDKFVSINDKKPRNGEDAVNIIKEADTAWRAPPAGE